MSIDLEINGLQVRLGDPEGPAALRQAGFRSPPVWRRLLLRDSDRSRWVANNCTVTAWDGALSLYPCIDRYLNHDRRWQTRAGLVYAAGCLEEVSFEVIEGKYAAPNYFDLFQDLCSRDLGDPLHHNGRLVWKNGRALAEGELSLDGLNALFHWRLAAADPGASHPGAR
ncbi:MAG: hypothetical protein R6X25_14005 [Candidatus Krumholzibacteriia bacterium]